MIGPSHTMLAAEALYLARGLHDEFDVARAPGTRAAWDSVTNLAELVMVQPVTRPEDMLLQLSTAASWMDLVVDTTEDGSVSDRLAQAIQTVLTQATLFFNRTIRLPDGSAANLLEDQVSGLIRCGANLSAGERVADRRFSWSDARETLRAATRAYETVQGTDAADAATEAEGLALDHLIEKVPAPDGCALAEKIVIAMERAAPFEGALFDDHAAAILADARRLAGVA